MDGRSISAAPKKQARAALSASRLALHFGFAVLAFLLPIFWDQAVRHTPALARYNIVILAILGGVVVIGLIYALFQTLFRETNGTARMIVTMTTIAVFSFLLSALSGSVAPIATGAGLILVMFSLRRSQLFVERPSVSDQG